MTSGDILNALRQKYPPKEYAFLCEVRNQTGFGRRVRSADALAISLWPSRGIYAIGFEVKVTRGDWLKELADPSKADEFFRFCQHWFIAAPVGLIGVAELPPTWGLLEVDGTGKVKCVKAAPQQLAQHPTWELFASLARQAEETWVPRSLVDKEKNDALEEARKRWEAGRERDRRHAEKELASLREHVKQFEDASGVRLDKYDPNETGKIGASLSVIRQWQNGWTPLASAQRARIELERIIADIKTLEEELG